MGVVVFLDDDSLVCCVLFVRPEASVRASVAGEAAAAAVPPELAARVAAGRGGQQQDEPIGGGQHAAQVGARAAAPAATADQRGRVDRLLDAVGRRTLPGLLDRDQPARLPLPNGEQPVRRRRATVSPP